MSVIDSLIINRTQADVDTFVTLARIRWQDMTDEEKTKFNAGRGAYSFADMNRVGEAINYLVERLNASGERILDVEGITGYTAADYITPEKSAEYLATVKAARAMFPVYSTTPSVPDSLAALSYSKANDIERILYDIDELITKSEQIWLYSGEIYSGEVLTDEG